MICSQCGKVSAESHEYCIYCGAMVSGEPLTGCTGSGAGPIHAEISLRYYKPLYADHDNWSDQAENMATLLDEHQWVSVGGLYIKRERSDLLGTQLIHKQYQNKSSDRFTEK